MNISLPKTIEVEEVEKGTKSQVVIEPCFPGYGMTLGNALRRVLLSSLPGGAITAVKIKGVQHEFSTIDNVTEDVVDIVLNLKQLQVKVHSDEPVSLKLKIKGEQKVTAGDFEASSDAEVTNKSLVIATLNDKDAELDMEITVARGIGYVPTEDQVVAEKEIGLILVDSIFTPVINVGLKVEPTRVGKRTDYDKIILDIETDGTISPEQAVLKSAEILSGQFEWILKGGEEEVLEIDLEKPVEEELAKESKVIEEVVEDETEAEDEVDVESDKKVVKED
jgi:DNA-directed RNA polymerase subunit alpha